MKSEGLCSKLTVPSELLDRTDVFIFDCDGVIVSHLVPRFKIPFMTTASALVNHS